MAMEVTIRRATVADAQALSAISKQTFFDTFTGTCTDADMESFLESYYNLQQVASELSDSNDHYYLAEINGKAVGYLRFMEDYKSFAHIKQWKALELKRIYVDKIFHGKGIAQMLMKIVMKHANDNNYEVVWLGVWEHNLRAQSFYEKLGFVNSGFTHDFPIGNTPQRDKWLWKFL